MKKKITIELEDNDWGQIIDGLTCRAQQYEFTAIYHECGYCEEDIAEVQDEDEARVLAEWYRGVIENIEKQLAKKV